MSTAGPLLLAFAVAYGCAVAAPLILLRLRVVPAAKAAWCLVPVILACPLLIPSASVGLRAASAVLSGDLAFKIIDYFRRWDRLDRGTILRDYYGLLIPFPVFAVVYPDQRRRLGRPESPWPHLSRIVVGIACVIGSVLTLRFLSGTDPIRSSFALHHAAMLLAFVVAVESLSRALCGLEHLAGFDTTPIIRDIYLSRTVSEFWRRYNDRIHEWMYRNVFRTTGGRRAPARSVVLVFLVSGVFHELMFGIATSRFSGYQLAFFTLQAPAALASGRLERLAKRGGIAGRFVAHGSTILFLAVTSVLFFDGVSKVFPFIYASTSPLPRSNVYRSPHEASLVAPTARMRVIEPRASPGASHGQSRPLSRDRRAGSPEDR
ncbi:MBOAT family O-acyltransferase [Tundrisphaera lichenicola]|uniref:MBOAT family O-acyltransferase n=1 Tax=Tundrisphaera lichenicola TaxID=2029860 RepID=UPI003EB8389E